MEKKGGVDISDLWPHSPSLTDYQASKVVTHGKTRFFGVECFDKKFGLFRRRSYLGNMEDKATIIE